MSRMEEAAPSFLDLPDDVICVLLRYLDATSLYFLGRTCIHLDDLIRNHFTLWRRIDARRSPNHLDKISYCLERCYDDDNSGTHTLLIRGDHQLTPSFCRNFFMKINTFTKLTVLALEDQTFDGSDHNVMTFPPWLHELSLKRTVLKDSLEFFKGSGDHFKDLRVLVLDKCDWLNSSAFMPISKYRSLEILSIYKCANVEESIAYLSLAGQGFRTLKILDARLSPLGNVLMHAIHKAPALLAIYLQNNDASYKLDFYKRCLSIQRGAPRRDFLTKNAELDLDKGEHNTLDFEDLELLDDNGLIDYLSVNSEEKIGVFPKSILYLDPYSSCTCDFDRKQFNSAAPPGSPRNDDDNSGDDFLVQKITTLSNLLNQTHRRTPFNQPRSRFPLTPTTVIQVHRNNGDQDNNIITFINLLPEDSNSRDGPPAKRRKTDDSVPGPSGLNADYSIRLGNRNNSQQEEAAQRPPTPHPDIVYEDHRRQASVQIYLRDSPIVRIESIRESQKNMRVPLRRLSLRGYKKITNSVLFYLKGLELELLDLTYTSVTVEGIQDYLKSHPLCRVVHEKFCTCPTNLHF